MAAAPTLDYAVTMRWIVGDLQGCATEFSDLIEATRFDPSRDELWCAGDLVNRGPASLEALRLWRDIGGHAVLGNHDLYALAVHSGLRERRNDTLDALWPAPDAGQLLERLRNQPMLVALPSAGDGPDVWLIHAGLHPKWRDLTATAESLNALPHDDVWLGREDVAFAATVRCCRPGGKQPRGHEARCPDGYRPWFAHYRGKTLVVHGHWATRGYYRRKRSLGLDSGCVHGGPLTAWCQDEDRIVQIPSRQPKRY